MRVLDIIQRKRDGFALQADEIDFFIREYNNGNIPDYQAAAWLMAVYFQGMNEDETASLTNALVCSGETLDLSAIDGIVIDKHSTGGVGDKTTLVLLPLAAAAGLRLAKISGRGLGHTGGTIDKLSCIPGFSSDLPRDRFLTQVKEAGLALIGQSPRMTPADGKLYALRDVTATVDSIPLIASSVMSKKIAAGAQGIVLDVKTGSGAFMQDAAQAKKLAETMVSIGRKLGRRTVALITNMEQPLGFAVGNHLEVIEAFNTLRGAGPADLLQLCLELGTEMLLMAGLEKERESAYSRLTACLADGLAEKMLRRWIENQGGDASVVDDYTRLGTPRFRLELRTEREGYIERLDARAVGRTAVVLGAGREKKEDAVDLLAGILLARKAGDYVRPGELLAELFSSSEDRLAPAREILMKAFGYGEIHPATIPLILDRIYR